jgi:microsomal dipeptidase-like Zn-dependent dipeptidase
LIASFLPGFPSAGQQFANDVRHGIPLSLADCLDAVSYVVKLLAIDHITIRTDLSHGPSSKL